MSARPAAKEARLEALDVLRAVALFGVLAVNLLTEFRVSLFEQFLPKPPGSAADKAWLHVLSLAVETKAFILFSLLFGVGLAAQAERTPRFGPYAARRLGMLLAIGLVHMFLVWDGDVLLLYAIVGLATAPLLRLKARALLVVAIVALGVSVAPIHYPPVFPTLAAMKAHIAAAHRAYGEGSYVDVLAFRLRETRPIAILLLFCLARTVGLFFLGACVWRSRLLHGRSPRLVVAIAVACVPLGALGVSRATGGVAQAAAIVLALGYAAAVVALFASPLPGARRALGSLAPLGRMALTSYLTQSIVFGLVFYGYGLGLFGKLDVARAAALGAAVYVAQAVFAAAWLRRFRFGPAEWLWRSFTYASWQPMRAGGDGGRARARAPSR